MLFVAEYEITWATLDAAIAKRLEWDEVKPDGFRFIGEYVWQGGEPSFRGVAIIEAESVEGINSFVLHYGPTLTMRVHPASDVVTAIAGVGTTGDGGARRKPQSRRPTKRRR
jgi:hypothetical protein